MNTKKTENIAIIFSLDDSTNPGQLFDLFAAKPKLEKNHEYRGIIQFLDTYDWRLLRNHLELYCTQGENRQTLSLRETGSGQILATAETRQLPQNIDTIPPGRLKNLVQKIINHRTLLDACQYDTHATEYQIRDEKQKPVSRLFLYEAGTYTFRDQENQKVGTLVQLLPVRGREKSCLKIQEQLANMPGVHTEEQSLGKYFACQSNHPLYQYFSQAAIHIDPDTTTVNAVKKLLRHFFNIMQHNQDGILKKVDTECLHDFRTSLRKSRSLLRSFKKIFPKDLYLYIKAEFEWLSTATSETRDIDVQLASFSIYEEMIPAYMHTGLNMLKKLLATRQTHAYEGIESVLQSDRYASFSKTWSDFLASDECAHPKYGKMPISEVANRKIWKAYTAVMEQGKKVDEFSQDEMLHSLRKLCKKLRYLLEAFHDIYPAKDIKKNIRKLKQLQNYLGEYQDFSVQVNALEQSLADLPREDSEFHMCIDSVNELKRAIENRKRYMRIEFPEVFTSFSSSKNRKSFRKNYHESKS